MISRARGVHQCEASIDGHTEESFEFLNEETKRALFEAQVSFC